MHNCCEGCEAQRQAWLASQGEQEEKPDNTIVPEPEVRATSIDIGDPRLPGGAKQIIKLARDHGWQDRTTYSRGAWLEAGNWTVSGIVDLVRVRLIRGNVALAAWWRNGKFEVAWHFAKGGSSLPRLNSKALKKLIKDETDEPGLLDSGLL